MERIDSQVRLPLGMAVQISLQGIRKRLGRAIVTLSGVVLGIAFLMSVLTGELVKNAVSSEQELRRTVNLMNSGVKLEIGSPKDKKIAVAVIGRTSRAERELIRDILRAKPAEVLGYGVPIELAMVTERNLADIGRGASVFLLLGNGESCPASLSELTRGMVQPVLLDSLASRTFLPSPDASVRRELFFGREVEEASKEGKAKREQQRARTIWIVTVSLLVTVIGISNSLLMSVTERFKEIGTMKCLGALSGFIRQLFLVESAVIGLSGSFAGIILGALFPLVAYSITYGFAAMLGSMDYGRLAFYGLICLLGGTALSILAAIYPANLAARMLPAMALRSNV